MFKKFLAMLVTVLVLITIVSCNKGEGAAAGAADDGSPTDISLYFAFDGLEYPQPDNEVERIIEAYTNTNLAITGYVSNYTSMYPTIIASGELPDVITALDMPLTKDMMRNDMFWDFTPYLSQFPNLKFQETTLVNSRVDGMLIGIPKVRPLVRRCFMYRKDWADKLGIAKPTTLEQFHEMMRRFTFEDPDGNGRHDTYGLLADRSAATGHISWFFGRPNNWLIDGTQAIKDFETPEYFEGLQYLKRLRDEGLLHPEWSFVDRNQFYNYFTEGLGGVFRDSTNAIQMVAARLQVRFPEADIDSIILIEDVNTGEYRTIGESGHLGWLSVPKTVPEAKMLKILAFLDKMSDEEMSTLMRWGIEGQHYNVVDGIIVPIPEAATSYEDMVRYPYMLPFSTTDYDAVARKGEYNKYVLQALDIEQNYNQYVVPNPVYTLDSQTNLEVGSTLSQIMTDTSVKFVEGTINEAEYWAEVQRWRDTGGDKVREEYLASWNAQYGN